MSPISATGFFWHLLSPVSVHSVFFRLSPNAKPARVCPHGKSRGTALGRKVKTAGRGLPGMARQDFLLLEQGKPYSESKNSRAPSPTCQSGTRPRTPHPRTLAVSGYNLHAITRNIHHICRGQQASRQCPQRPSGCQVERQSGGLIKGTKNI